jgi:hypothetical protein
MFAAPALFGHYKERIIEGFYSEARSWGMNRLSFWRSIFGL